jgi:hypothetical protein
LFGYEELSGDDFLFDGNDSFDLLAVDHECGVEASTEACASVNPLQDASPSINLSQELGKKRMQDPVAMEGQLVPQHLKRYCMPKEVVDLSLSLHGLMLNSAMRHNHLQSDASLAWNSRHGHPLGRLILIGSQLKNGLNQLLSQQIQMLHPLSTLPTRLMCIPHALPMVVPSMNPLVTWRVRYSEKRRTLSMRYNGISFCMC